MSRFWVMGIPFAVLRGIDLMSSYREPLLWMRSRLATGAPTYAVASRLTDGGRGDEICVAPGARLPPSSTASSAYATNPQAPNPL